MEKGIPIDGWDRKIGSEVWIKMYFNAVLQNVGRRERKGKENNICRYTCTHAKSTYPLMVRGVQPYESFDVAWVYLLLLLLHLHLLCVCGCGVDCRR